MADTGSRVSNLKVFEITATACAVHTFPWPVTQLMITNDDSNNTADIKMGGDTLSLKPKETLTLTDTRIRRVATSGASIPLRIWGWG